MRAGPLYRRAAGAYSASDPPHPHLPRPPLEGDGQGGHGGQGHGKGGRVLRTAPRPQGQPPDAGGPVRGHVCGAHGPVCHSLLPLPGAGSDRGLFLGAGAGPVPGAGALPHHHAPRQRRRRGGELLPVHGPPVRPASGGGAGAVALCRLSGGSAAGRGLVGAPLCAALGGRTRDIGGERLGWKIYPPQAENAAACGAGHLDRGGRGHLSAGGGGGWGAPGPLRPLFPLGGHHPVRPEPGGGGGALPALYPQQQAGDPHPGYHAADAHRLLPGHGPVYPLAGRHPLGHPPAGGGPGGAGGAAPGAGPHPRGSECHPAAAPGAGGGGQGERAAQGGSGGLPGPRSQDPADLGGGLPHPAAGRPRPGRRPAGQVHRHRPGQGPEAGGAAGGVFRHHPDGSGQRAGGAPAHPAVHAAGAARRRVLPPLCGEAAPVHGGNSAPPSGAGRPGQTCPGL